MPAIPSRAAMRMRTFVLLMVAASALLLPDKARPQAPDMTDIGASIDIASKRMHGPTHPKEYACTEGTVVLIIDVDQHGHPVSATVEKSSRTPQLDQAALSAAKEWKFNPAVVHGELAAGRVRVPVDFAVDADTCWSDISPGSAATPDRQSSRSAQWPDIVEARKLTGNVTLLVSVTEQGSMDSVMPESSSGYREIDQAAVDAAPQRYVPAKDSNGKPVRSVVRVPMTYGSTGFRN